MSEDAIRLDTWLWQARFFRSRAIAARLCAKGRVRIDGAVVKKAHFLVRPEQVLTFPQARRIRVVRVRALGARRGPAPEARLLYDELSDAPPVPRFAGGRAARRGRGAAMR